MATNDIKAQSRIADKLFYTFEQGGEFLQHVNFKSDDFKPADNVGGSYTYRRPGKLQTTATALDARGTTPTVGSAPTYSAMTEPVFTMTVARKFVQRIAVSSQDLTTALSTDQVEERSVRQGAQALKRQIELYAAGIALASTSQIIGTPGTPATGDTLLTNMAKANELINSRGVVDTGKRVGIVPSMAVPTYLAASRGLYNPNADISKQFRSGTLGQIAGINWSSSALLPKDTVTIAGTPTITVSGAYRNAGAVWTPTWSLPVSSSANLVIPAGTLFKISNSGTDLTWVVPDVFTDIGVAATFRTVTDVTLDGAGAGTLIVTEPLIADTTNGTLTTNGYQNVSANPASGASITLLNKGVNAAPALVFDPEAILGVSPKIHIPSSIWSKSENINGVNLTFIKSADPYNYSEIWELQAMVGFAVGLPEAVVALY